MATIAGKVISWIAIGAGSILSVLSAGTLAPIGIPLIAAGTAGLSVSGGSTDKVTNAANSLISSWNQASAVGRTAETPSGINRITAFVQDNFIIIIAAVGAYILFKRFKKRR